MSRTPRTAATGESTDGSTRRDGATACRLHATAIAVGSSGVLIMGASGRGKSNLALRTLARAPNTFLSEAVTLIADDQVDIERTDGALRATAPATIAGKLEVRGVGIVNVPHMQSGAVVRLIVRLTDTATIERLPLSPQVEAVLGQPVPTVDIDPADPAAVEKILVALRELGGGTGRQGAKT